MILLSPVPTATFLPSGDQAILQGMPCLGSFRAWPVSRSQMVKSWSQLPVTSRLLSGDQANAINPLGGRDHWPRAGFALLAGAGMPEGAVIGATDARGAEPTEQPISPESLASIIRERTWQSI